VEKAGGAQDTADVIASALARGGVRG
jgi:hypothetical protein